MPPATPDPLRIVESAYAWNASESTWLAHVLAAAAPFSTGRGVVACTLRTGTKVVLEEIAVGSGATTDDAAGIRRFCETLSPKVAPGLFAPTEIVGNAGYRLERLARANKTTSLALSGGVPLPPMWALLGGQPRERAVMVAFLATTAVAATQPFPHDERRVLGMVGAHLGAALRLRALAPAEAEADTEAVLTTDGKVVHAVGVAKTRRARESLTSAVLRSERARGKLRRVDAVEATALWTALAAGRWSILESTESDGKRFLLARKNKQSTPDILELSRDESDVVWLAVEGHSQKYIAYELGFSIAVVARRLHSAMRKLRVDSRRELLQKLGVPTDD
ncbi:hypothetical protein BH09MYX1_BH09MYX1_44230 [soil metagenome]